MTENTEAAMVDEPSVGAIADNNQVPEFRTGEHRVLKNLVRFGARRLLGGAPAARWRLSRPAPTVLITWAPWILGPWGLGSILIALSAGGTGGTVGTLVFAIAGGLLWLFGVLPLLFAAGVDSTVPPAPRPDCQAETLGDKPHPFYPFDRQTGLLEYFEGQLWMAQIPLVFHGVQMGARMVVARAGSAGELLVYSPLPLDEAMKERVQTLGEPRWIVAPNAIHHLYVGPWLEAFPGAEAWAAPNLASRRPDLRWAGTIEDSEAEVPWDREIIDFTVIKGHAFHQEIVLFHRPSRTLLVADALENLGHRPETSRGLAHFLGLFAMAGRPTPPTDLKLSIHDRAAAARAARAVLAWDFDRIVLAHGRLIERDAKATFSDAWAFVLG